MNRLVLIHFVPALLGCSGPAPEPKLSALQKGIFTPTCAFASCHGETTPQKGLSLANGKSYAALVNVPSTANPAVMRVVPGDAAGSLVAQVLEGPSHGVRKMPMTGALTPAEIQAIREWIRLGAPND